MYTGEQTTREREENGGTNRVVNPVCSASILDCISSSFTSFTKFITPSKLAASCSWPSLMCRNWRNRERWEAVRLTEFESASPMEESSNMRNPEMERMTLTATITYVCELYFLRANSRDKFRDGDAPMLFLVFELLAGEGLRLLLCLIRVQNCFKAL